MQSSRGLEETQRVSRGKCKIEESDALSADSGAGGERKGEGSRRCGQVRKNR